MKTTPRSLLLLLPLLAAPAGSAPDTSLTVTYVANEGFLVRSADKALLVDALFEEGFGRYAVPPPELVGRMTEGRAPFARADVYLVTHGHRDHFAAAQVASFLKRHAETTLVAPEAVAARLRENGAAPARLEMIRLEVGATASLTAGGIPITVVRLKHNMDTDGTHEPNLAYLVTLGGKRVLHLGDAPVGPNAALLERAGLAKGGIDLLFLQSFDVSEATAKFVAERLRPRHVIAMHVPVEPDEAGLAAFRRLYEGAIVFSDPLQATPF